LQEASLIHDLVGNKGPPHYSYRRIQRKYLGANGVPPAAISCCTAGIGC
jgi:hypothetical protein